MKGEDITDPVICTRQRFKLTLYKHLLRALSAMSVDLYKVTIRFAGKNLAFLVPVAYAERALNNIEHVLVNCDYYHVLDATPKPGSRVIDVGAFLGFYTIASSTLVTPSGVVYSIEPNKGVLPLLYRNVHINESSRVYIYPVAVCSESGFKKLYIGDYPAVSSLLREHVEYHSSIKEVIEVKCSKLSNLLRYLGALDVLKLDIEGLEVEVLREALNELHRVDAIVVEVHTNIADLGEIENILNRVGFSRVVIYVSAEMPHQVIVYAVK